MSFDLRLCNKNSKNRPLFYLAGPMQYTPDNGEGWRVVATRLIEGAGMGCISPLEYEEVVVGKKGLEAIHAFCSAKSEDKPSEFVMDTMHRLMVADLYAVEMSDYILVQYAGEKISGSAHECGKAWELGKKCLLVNKCKSIHDIPLWFLACFDNIFDSLEEAVNYVVEKEK